MIVNERRAARGLPPYPFNSRHLATEGHDAFLDEVLAESRTTAADAKATAAAAAPAASKPSMQ